jgi:hypothetical protein
MFNVPNARAFGNYFQQTFTAAFANTTNAGYDCV